MTTPRLGYIDVGARDGSGSHLLPFLDTLDRVLVEPDAAEAGRLAEASAGGRQYIVIGTALAHIDGEIDLHVARNPTCTSALPVARPFLSRYGIGHHFETQSTLRVPCARYDTLFAQGGLPLPHIIKADVQGFEYQVLLGFGALLANCLAIEIETHFYEIYEDQRLFGDMTAFLGTFGFVLRSLGLPRAPSLKGDPHFDGDLVEIDAVFTKNRHWVQGQAEAVRMQFATACEVMGVASYGP